MTLNEQKLALDHLWYETWMLDESFKRWEQNSNQLDFNIYIETFLLHARNLIFFLEDKKDDRDIRCSDFRIGKIIVCLPQNINLEKINKFVNHLAWDRVKQEKPIWSPEIVKKILMTIIKDISIFVNKLPDDLFPTIEYKKTKDSFKALLKI